MMWAGPIENCIGAIDRICALDPALIVPGHGPVTDVSGARGARASLELVAREAELRLRRGMSPLEALEDIGVGPFSALLEPQRMLNIADLVYAGLDPGYARISGAEMYAGMATLAASWDVP